MIKKITPFLLFLFLLSCENNLINKNNDDEDSRVKKITIDDFAITPTSLSSLDAEEEINKERDFFCTKPEEEEEMDENCLSEKMDSVSFQAADNGFYELLIENVNLKDCLYSTTTTNVFGSEIINKLSYDFYFKYKIIDENNTSVNLEGLKYSDLSQFNNHTIYLIEKFYGIYEIEYNIFDEKAIVTVELLGLNSAASNPEEPCIVNSNLNIYNDYSEREITKLTSNNEDLFPEDIALTVLNVNNLEYNSNGTYHTGGSISFVINNWSGVMTYHETDSESKPTYTATNGLETLAGTFNYISKKLK